MKSTNKSGSAIPIVLIFATLMFTMGLAYSKMTQSSKIQTNQINERIKLDYAIESMAELALLKYQLYPADFYACEELKSQGNSSFYETFIESKVTGNDAPFWTNDSHAVSSFSNAPVHCELVSMQLFTNQKWGKEALKVEVHAVYDDIYHKTIDKTGTRVFQTERFIDNEMLK